MIAAVVSIAVAVGSVAVTFMTTRASLRRDHERQEAEFRRTMTTRLYDRRVAMYPGLFRATDAFRQSRLSDAQDLAGGLRGCKASLLAGFVPQLVLDLITRSHSLRRSDHSPRTAFCPAQRYP